MWQNELGEAVGRVTIYRILNIFCKDGIIHRILGDDRKFYFASCMNCSEKTHRHYHFHFKCMACRKTERLRMKRKFIYRPAISQFIARDVQISNLKFTAYGISDALFLFLFLKSLLPSTVPFPFYQEIRLRLHSDRKLNNFDICLKCFSDIFRSLWNFSGYSRYRRSRRYEKFSRFCRGLLQSSIFTAVFFGGLNSLPRSAIKFPHSGHFMGRFSISSFNSFNMCLSAFVKVCPAFLMDFPLSS